MSLDFPTEGVVLSTWRRRRMPHRALFVRTLFDFVVAPEVPQGGEALGLEAQRVASPGDGEEGPEGGRSAWTPGLAVRGISTSEVSAWAARRAREARARGRERAVWLAAVAEVVLPDPTSLHS